MKFTLLVVGRTVEKHYITAINDYVERTKHYVSFDMEVIPELKNTKSLSMEQQKEKEGEAILKALQPGDVVVLLDEHGKEFRSIEFANWIEPALTTTNKPVISTAEYRLLSEPVNLAPSYSTYTDFSNGYRISGK